MEVLVKDKTSSQKMVKAKNSNEMPNKTWKQRLPCFRKKVGKVELRTTMLAHVGWGMWEIYNRVMNSLLKEVMRCLQMQYLEVINIAANWLQWDSKSQKKKTQSACRHWSWCECNTLRDFKETW